MPLKVINRIPLPWMQHESSLLEWEVLPEHMHRQRDGAEFKYRVKGADGQYLLRDATSFIVHRMICDEQIQRGLREAHGDRVLFTEDTAATQTRI